MFPKYNSFWEHLPVLFSNTVTYIIKTKEPSIGVGYGQGFSYGDYSSQGGGSSSFIQKAKELVCDLVGEVKKSFDKTSSSDNT